MSDAPTDPPFQTDVIRQVDWVGVAPWLVLLRAPGVALGFHTLLFAIAGALLSCGELGDPSETFARRDWFWDHGLVRFVNQFVVPCENALSPSVGDQRLGWLMLGLWRLLVWSFFGLGVAYAAGRSLTYAPEHSLKGTILQTIRRWPVLLGALAMIGGLAALAYAALGLAGILVNTPVLGWVVEVLWSVVMLLSVCGFILTVSFTLVSPLMWATVALETPDPFDAVSRLLAYATQRLARLVFYAGVAFLIGYSVTLIVDLLCLGVLQWTPDVTLEGHGKIAAWWEGVIVRIAHAVYPAYFFTAATAIYLLLRHDIDGQPIDEMDA